MSERFADWDARALELAADLVTVGLEPHERAELERLARPEDVERFEHAASAVHLAALPALEAPPATLLERLERVAASQGFDLGAAAPSASAPERALAPARGGPTLGSVLGWLVAAGLLVYVAGTRFGARVPDATLAPEARREALLAAAGELVRADFRATDDPLAAGAEGDLVWSGARQEGYMRLRNLPANDPTEEQYQLWIFDSTRADWEELPVDGGVFDVANGGEVVVPIEAKLDVRAPALFAITLERPGGVVVSEREHLLLLGSP